MCIRDRDYTGKAWDRALAYGLAIGGARAGLLETTYRTETETCLLYTSFIYDHIFVMEARLHFPRLQEIDRIIDANL